MSAYDWPQAGAGAEDEDDPLARRRFLARRRIPSDHELALRAVRTMAPPAPRATRGRRRPAGAPFAPPSGVHNVWLPLGPMTVIGGQAEGRTRVAGRVRALAVHPDGERLYAAAANGGIWYSTDAGVTWRSIGGFAPTNTAGITRPAHRNACGAVLAIFDHDHPDDESKDLVLVGTGETSPRDDAEPGSNLGGVGILVATGPAASTASDPWTREAPNLVGRGVHRLAAEPGGTRIVAATSIGLFERPSSPGADVDWIRVASTPFDSLESTCTEALWTAGGGGQPARLWVWVRGGDEAGLWVRADGDAAFTKIPTPGTHRRRSVLAAAAPPSKVYVFNDRHNDDPALAKKPALFRINAAGAGTPTATEVENGVPDMLGYQGFYDMAIAVDPANADQVVLGGSAFGATNAAGTSFTVDDGAIFTAEIGMSGGKLTYGHATAAAMIGVGVHADVHDLRFAKAGARLFASCDGGVYRSDRPTKLAGFVACNDGLPVIEADYIACHPTCEGLVVVGLQDNGIIERASSTVWQHAGDGDAGGVAFDVVDTTRYMRQYHNASWTASDGSAGFDGLLSRGPASDSRKDERKEAAFYSTPAVIKHSRPGPPAVDVGQVLVATDRVWYTEDWGAHWVTLPTGTDPLTAATYNRSQDRLQEAVIVCRWQSPDVAWILGEGIVVRLARVPGSADAGGPGTWSRELVIRKGVKNKKDATSAEGPIREAVDWTDIAVNLDAGGVQHGTKGAVYVGTTGHPTKTEVDTLWWFDGTHTWHPTGLRAEGVTAPVTAVLCDPAHPEIVYVGTTVGVWRGTRTLPGGQPPDWSWEVLVNGLPEAAVEDLALFDSGGMRLLRAAIAARGVWELEIDADVTELTYVRAHDDDMRRRARALELQRDGSSTRSWHGSPDVRPRAAPGAITRPSTLPWTRTSGDVDAETLRRFQAALRSQKNDPRCRATGEWDLYFEEVLRDNGAPESGTKIVSIDDAFWDSVMVAPHATAEPWGAGPPQEADLYELTPRLVEGNPNRASCRRPPQRLKVDVVIHHRGTESVAGADVRVTMLHWIDPRTRNRAQYDDATTWFSGNAPWTAAVNEVLNSSGGTTSQTFTQGWAFTKPGPNRRQTLTGQTLDATRPGVATFDIDLRGARANLLVLLVAVIRVGSDIALAPASLQDIALANPTVAVRSMRISA